MTTTVEQRRIRTDWTRPPSRLSGNRLPKTDAEAIWETYLGHMATMSASQASRMPGMPSRVAFVKKRARDPDYAARAAIVMRARRLDTSGRPRISSDQWREFLDRLPNTSVNALVEQPGMPSIAAVYKRRRIDAAFAAEFDKIIQDADRIRTHRIAAGFRLADKQRDGAFVSAMRKALAEWRLAHPPKPRIKKPRRPQPPKPQFRRPVPLGEAFTVALLRNELYAAANAAVPPTLDRVARMEIIADLVLGVLEGKIAVESLPQAAKLAMRDHWRLFNDRRAVSLDAQLPGTDGLTRLATLSGDMQDYW